MLFFKLRKMRARNPAARRDAALALGRVDDPRATSALAEALTDPDDTVGSAAAEALLGKGAEGVAALLTELRAAGQREGGQPWRRITGLLGDLPESLVDQITRGLDRQAPALRREAVKVLAALEDPKATPALVRAMGDADDAVVAEAVEALARSGPSAVPALIGALENGGAPARRCVARALAQYPGPTVVDALATALGDRDAEVRRAAARALGTLKDPRSLEALVATLRDASGAVAQEAAVAVGQIGDPRAVDALVAAARGQTGQGANLALVEALGRLADPRALDFLLQRLDHPDPKLVTAAARALGSFQEPGAVDALIVKLEHGHEGVRVAAANSLARIGNPMAATALHLAIERAARRSLPEEREFKEALRKLTAPRG